MPRPAWLFLNPAGPLEGLAPKECNLGAGGGGGNDLAGSPFSALLEARFQSSRLCPSLALKAPTFPSWASLVAQKVKHLPAMRETWVRSLGQKIPWRRKWQPTPVLLPGKFHGPRSLVGYSPWDHKESDTTERLQLFLPSLGAVDVAPPFLASNSTLSF